MERTLDDIAGDYERAEVTVLWVNDRTLKTQRILFCAVELCPAEQSPSAPFRSVSNDGRSRAMERSPLNEQDTLYVTRDFSLNPAEALHFYRGTSAGRRLRIDGRDLHFLPTELFGEEGPREHPLVVATGNRAPAGIYGILPGRASLRVCSKFAKAHEVLGKLGERERKALRAFSMKTLGFDLVRHYEHLEAVHLLLPNPLLRRWTTFLAANEQSVLVEFFEREGKVVNGCSLRLTDTRPGGVAFDRTFPIAASRQVLPTPYPVGSLTYRLYDPWGALLDEHEAAFIREVNLTMGLSSTRRVIIERDEFDNEKLHEVSVFSYEKKPARIAPTSVRELFHQAREGRAETPDFHFFPAGSRAEGREHLRTLMSHASQRVLLCDPYLSAKDVDAYALFVPVSRLPIWLLGSAYFLRGHTEGGAKDYGSQLKQCVDSLVQRDRSLTIDVRVIAGAKKCPVHDRFLLIDDTVYVLGSSVNEFGERATTCARAPATAGLAAQVARWWHEAETLETWLANRTAENT